MSRRGVLLDSMALKVRAPLQWNVTSDALYLSGSKRGLYDQLVSVPIDHRSGHFVRTIDTLGIDLTESGHFDASRSQHTFAYLSTAYTDSIWAVELQGSTATSRLLRGSTAYQDNPSISPDGRTVAFLMDDQVGENLYTMPFAGGSPTALTADANQHPFFRWFPEGRQGVSALVQDSPVMVTVGYPDGKTAPIRSASAIASATSFAVTDSGTVWQLSPGHFACVDRGDAKSVDVSIAKDWLLVKEVRDRGNALLVALGPGNGLRFARLSPRCQMMPVTLLMPFFASSFPRALHWGGDTLVWATPATDAGAVSPHLVVWRSDGRAITKVADLPASCSIAPRALTMSDDGRRLVCEQTINKHDVVLLHDFKPPRH